MKLKLKKSAINIQQSTDILDSKKIKRKSKKEKKQEKKKKRKKRLHVGT